MVTLTFPKAVRLSSRAQEFSSNVFRPAYESLQNAASQTPLVIMLWGPRQRSREWSNRRAQIRESLEQQGHTAFFSEQLGVPVASASQKGVEFLQSEAADLIVVIQSLYGLVGSVRHFVEYRIVDAKMLLFIDETASDQHFFARALEGLRANYNNVETFKSLGDDLQTMPLKQIMDKVRVTQQIVDKVRVMQLVKYRATHSARSWGLRPEESVPTPIGHRASAQPYRYNLLELYREHRPEIDVLTQPMSLFLLAFARHVAPVSHTELAREVGLTPAELAQELGRLQRADFLAETGDRIAVTGVGKRLLEATGFAAPVTKVAPAIRVPVKAPRPFKWQQTATWSTAAGVGLATVILVSISILIGANITQNNQPLVLTPAHTLTAPTKTMTPNRAAIPATVPLAPATPPGQ